MNNRPLLYMFPLLLACTTSDPVHIRESARIVGLTPPLRITDAAMALVGCRSVAYGIELTDKNGKVLKYALAPQNRGQAADPGQSDMVRRGEAKRIVKEILSGGLGKPDTNSFYADILKSNFKEISNDIHQMDSRKSFLGAMQYNDSDAQEIGIRSKEEIAFFTIIKDYAQKNWPGKTTAIMDNEYRERYQLCIETADHLDCQPDNEWRITRTVMHPALPDFGFVH